MIGLKDYSKKIRSQLKRSYLLFTIDYSRIKIIAMKWYLAKIVYRIICGEGEHTAQFDEQLRLIAASDEVEAFQKARTIGVEEQESFYNLKQQPVRWQFVDVSELYRLSQLIDGAELYSRISEADDADAYISFVHHKSASIQNKYTHQLLNLI
jgi:hypothetical protein